MGRGQCQICGQVHASLRQSTVVDVSPMATISPQYTTYARTLPLPAAHPVSARRGAIWASALKNKRYDDGPPYSTLALPTTPRQVNDLPLHTMRQPQAVGHACPTGSLATREPPPIILISIIIIIIIMILISTYNHVTPTRVAYMLRV
ncbi:hypothetical protein COCMIDRAFT_26414 [Bipolaris oryzae ATCC 44560]|uniref:Uncharacterized protein n=1 Tax=Bipolaris oryzae ATCC 44560 TaxID=930090 RepID=W6Z0V8_COCMI|nr:uncharacterized protein COCMIDRAFT_26414 [Bipolaris oryzae ATCC 44560]EUC45392.1 hypothetical protein COCMIDRAFT_26414 [Bipolaris oryzae ATCC 44560]